MKKKAATKNKTEQKKESRDNPEVLIKLNGVIELHSIVRGVCERVRLEAEQLTVQAARLLKYRQELLKTHGIGDMQVMRSTWTFESEDKEEKL